MSAETTTERPTYVLARAEVRAVNRVSPSFVRVTFGGDELFEFGTPGEVFDSRIKLIFPPASGVLPTLDRETGDWWGSFLAVPEEERGSMRTYSVRDLRVDAEGTELDVDFVLHLEPGLTGPASLWASAAAVGQELFLVGPRRGVAADAHGGAEYAPGTAASVVLAGDETAAGHRPHPRGRPERPARRRLHRSAVARRHPADRRAGRRRGALAAP